MSQQEAPGVGFIPQAPNSSFLGARRYIFFWFAQFS